MSGIGPPPFRAKASFDPLLNPTGSDAGAAASPDASSDADPLTSLSRGSLAMAQAMPVEDLRRMALSAPSAADAQPPAATASQEDDDVPAQRMSDFLAAAVDPPPAPIAPTAAASALFDHLAPGVADAERQAAAKKQSLFADSDDEDDEETKQRKQAQRESARAAAKAAKEAQEEARLAALHSNPAPAASANGASPTTDASSVAASLGANGSSKRAQGGSLFDGEEEEEDVASDGVARAGRRLNGVFIPPGAAEYRTAEEKLEGEAVDPALLVAPDEEALERLGGGSVNGSAASAVPASATSAAAAAVPAPSISAASASSADADAVDDLDDLFSDFASPAKLAQPSAVDPSAADFSFADYLKQQRAGAAGGSTNQGASLFDDE